MWWVWSVWPDLHIERYGHEKVLSLISSGCNPNQTFLSRNSKGRQGNSTILNRLRIQRRGKKYENTWVRFWRGRRGPWSSPAGGQAPGPEATLWSCKCCPAPPAGSAQSPPTGTGTHADLTHRITSLGLLSFLRPLRTSLSYFSLN